MPDFAGKKKQHEKMHGKNGVVDGQETASRLCRRGKNAASSPNLNNSSYQRFSRPSILARLPKYINNYINMFVIQDMVHAALASDTKEISQSLSYRLILGTMQDFQNKTSVALELYILEGSSDAKKYLQNNAAKIAKAFAECGDNVALSKFVSLGLMDAEALLQTLPIAQEKELQTSIAYLLEDMRKYGLKLPDALEV